MKMLTYLVYCNKGVVLVASVIKMVSAAVFHKSLPIKKQYNLRSENSNTNVLSLLGLMNDFYASTYHEHFYILYLFHLWETFMYSRKFLTFSTRDAKTQILLSLLTSSCSARR